MRRPRRPLSDEEQTRGRVGTSACDQSGHVAFEAFRRREIGISGPGTVGSPLGMRAIRDRFRPIGFPAKTKLWYNAFDPRDVVALYPLDAANFPINPAVENYAKVLNATDNRHGIVGYLDDVDVAKHILDALGT
jgi:hypothetical protein